MDRICGGIKNQLVAAVVVSHEYIRGISDVK